MVDEVVEETTVGDMVMVVEVVEMAEGVDVAGVVIVDVMDIVVDA